MELCSLNYMIYLNITHLFKIQNWGILNLDTTAMIKLNIMEGLQELNNLVLSDIVQVSKIVRKQAIQNRNLKNSLNIFFVLNAAVSFAVESIFNFKLIF